LESLKRKRTDAGVCEARLSETVFRETKTQYRIPAMRKFQILNRQSGAVQVEVDVEIDVDLETASRSTQFGAAIIAAVEIGADLRGADLRGADLYGANLSTACLSGADLSGASLFGATLAGACLSAADLCEARLGNADLTTADLSGANLKRAELSDARLHDANLCGANLERASLGSANLCRANLRLARLSDATLDDADLNSADLSNAILTGARLTDAEFIGADLHGADLSRAGLEYTDLTSANLAGAKVDLISAEIAVPSLNRSILAARSQLGWIDEESIWGRATTCCRGGWAVILAGAPGWALARSHGLLAAAAFIHLASCPALEGYVPNFHAYDDESYKDLQRLAEPETDLPAGFEAKLRDQYQQFCGRTRSDRRIAT
jgi:uncharacterized protein YjbI with pentapeptide repeats